MAVNAVVGALRGALVLDTSEWSPAVGRARGDLDGLRGALEQVDRVLQNVSRQIRNVGAGVTVGLTVPLGALGVASNRAASNFEASMKRVEAALKGVTGKELKSLSDQAKALGPAVGKGATQAADGIEALGLAGVSTADILGGALKASLDLAAAGAVDVAPAASLVTDAMAQFKVEAASLPVVVNDVVGALDASKFGFIDFQGAIAQGGGVAASAGLSFRDFATAVAATSAQFSSGSDAGTSFKTYIQSLVPVSREAEYAMKQLGIEFFDVQTGRMKPLAEQAEILRTALANLSDKSKTDALKTIFGSDAARTAIGLMERGRQGIVDLQREIAGGDVGAKIAKRMEGEAAATTRLANAFESVKIAIGEAGLTALIASVKSAFASFLESIANANPAILKVGVAIGAVVAAIGPLMLALGTVVAFLVAKVARGFGMVGWAISAIIEPISTLGSAFISLLARVGIGRALGVIARAFLGLSNPIGWAITAVLLFKDSIWQALQQVWRIANETLGPPLQALFAKIGDVVSALSSGPIADGFNGLMSFLYGLHDVTGTVVGGLVELLGFVLVKAIEEVVIVISGIVDVVAAIVKGVSALLSGDFAGAWAAAGDMVDAICQTIIDVVSLLVPGIGDPLQQVYEGAKAYLVTGFENIADAFGQITTGAVNAFSAAFPNIVAAAKSAYEGVKAWLVDSFGPLMTWIGNAAKWIGDQYTALKKRLGFGDSAPGATPADPSPAPKPVAAPRGGTRSVDFTPPKKGRTGRERRGRDTQYDAENREQLRVQAELEAARERADRETEQRLQDQLSLSKQIEAYQRTGLSIDQARAAANRDMALIQAARAESMARQLGDERAGVEIDVARMNRNQALARTLERQQELKGRILRYEEITHDKVKARVEAERDQLEIDKARARVRQQWLADDARQRALTLGDLRGDSERQMRALEREDYIAQRSRQLSEGEAGLGDSEALTQATREWEQENRARITGVWRSTLKDGFRSALDGDLGGWFQNWWKERVAKGLEDALNSLADLISDLFSKAGSKKEGGGLFDSLVKAAGSIFGGSGGKDNWAGGVSGAKDAFGSIPGFKTGGSFEVGGMSGIDANLVQFRATKGEIVNISRGDRRERSLVIQIAGDEGAAFVPRVTQISGAAAGQTVQVVQRQSARRGRQRLA